MSDTPRAPSGRSAALSALSLLALSPLVCVGVALVYAVADYDHVRTTARELQAAGVVAAHAAGYGVAGAITLLFAAGVVAIIGLYTRWAAPAARQAALDVNLARAQHLELPDGLTSLTLQAPREKQPLQVQLQEPAGTQTVIDAPPEPPAPPPHEAFAYGVSRIQQLVERGDIIAGGEQLLVGYAGRQPAYIRAQEWGLAIVAGQSGKGKSSLAALIIAQAALAGWAIIVCDPVYHRERSLLRDYLGSISGAIWKQAVRPEEIAAAVAQAMAIASKRLTEGVKGSRVLLILDEFATISGGKMLDDAAMEQLFLTATKASAVGVHTLLIAHDLSGSWFGGQAARRGRDQATHRLICNMAPKAAEPILPGSEYAQQVAMLPVGAALYFDGFTPPAVVSFPRLTAADLAIAAGNRAPRPYQPWSPRPVVAEASPPAALPPTEPLPGLAAAPAPRAAPPTTLIAWTTKEKIVDVLSRHPAGLDALSIADALGEPATTVRSRLTELKVDGTVDTRRAPGGRYFIYSLVRRPPAA